MTKENGEGPSLLLFPTDLERKRFRDHGGVDAAVAVERIAGFGPVAAAARTSQLLAELRPRRVVLLGIAGTFEPDAHPVGEARIAATTTIEGIGVGEGEALRPPTALGFPQWPGTDGSSAEGDTRAEPIADSIELCVPPALAAHAGGLLLTTCAASDSPEQAAARKRTHPSAVAEDMEGYAVAFACALASVPLVVVRGLSNVVGDRDASHWRIPGALAAARRLALDVLGAEDWE